MGKKYFILVGVVLLQACLGGTYAWSLFDAKLVKLGWADTTISGIPFNTFYIVFPFTLLFARTIIQKLGTRSASLVGLFFFSGGWALCYFAQENIYLIIFGVGILGGIGVGICYLIPIMVGTSWFPNNAGLITGIAVAGFASGAAIVSAAADTMMSSFYWLPNMALGAIGISYIGIGIIPALSMVLHKGDLLPRTTQPISSTKVVSSRHFQTLFLAMTAGLTVGFFANSKLIILSEHFVPTAASLIGIFAICNALGRLTWGAISDHLNISNCIKANLLLQAFGFFVLFQLTGWQYSAVTVAGLTGFNYGGVLVLYANACRKHWGQNSFSRVYSLLFFSNIVAALMNTAVISFYHYYSITATSLVLAFILIISSLLIRD